MDVVRNRILVIGSNQINKQKFINSLFGIQLNWNSPTSNLPISPQYWEFSNHVIKTKYYTADVEIWLQLNDKVTLNNWKDSEEDFFGKSTDAVILLFEPKVENSWELVSEWEKFLEKYEPNTVMCVSVPSIVDKSKNENIDNQGYIDWCIDRHIEFVDGIDCERPPDADEREKFGIERVLEALENNVWVNMQKIVVQHRVNSLPEQTPVNSSGTISTEKLSDTNTTSNNQIDDISFTSSYVPANFFESLSAPGEDFDFEKVLHTLKALKEQASTLPDRERRSLAATVALSFAKLLGEDDDND